MSLAGQHEQQGQYKDKEHRMTNSTYENFQELNWIIK